MSQRTLTFAERQKLLSVIIESFGESADSRVGALRAAELGEITREVPLQGSSRTFAASLIGALESQGKLPELIDYLQESYIDLPEAELKFLAELDNSYRLAEADKTTGDVVSGDHSVMVFGDVIGSIVVIGHGASVQSSPLPLGSYVPYDQNPRFLNREQEIQRLSKVLLDPGFEEGQSIVITGLGGIGKTALVTEFAHRFGHLFEAGIQWVDFSDETSLQSAIAQSGRNMGLHDAYDLLPLQEQVRLVRQAWSMPRSRLLIFDHCENQQQVSAWRPRSGGARVVVTTRSPDWPEEQLTTTLAIDVLPTDQAIQLLQKYRPKIEEEQAWQLAEALGNLPLALVLAGSYLASYPESSISDYLAHLKNKGLEQGVWSAFTASYERLRLDQSTEDSSAIALLARAACFAPGEPIPKELLLASLPPDTMESATLAGLIKLVELGLLQQLSNQTYRLHRLLAHLVATALSEQMGEARLSVEEAVVARADQLNQTGDPRLLDPLVVHLRHLADAALEREDGVVVQLATNYGHYLRMTGNYTQARPYYERALAVCERILGPEHPDTAARYNDLGQLLHDQGDLQGAMLCYERALSIYERAFGSDSPYTASSLSNLGVLLYSTGNLEQARTYFERAQIVFEQVLGPEHPHTAANLNNLGALLALMGSLTGARTYYEQALAIRERILGPEHPDIATSLNNLGALLLDLGDIAGARPYYERALAIRERVLGPEHPDTATSLNNLGFLLQAMGDLAGARPYYERALAIRERDLGPEHPDTAASLNNLGYLLQAMDDLAGARPYFERALAIYERVLGPDHPDTAQSLNNLGALLDSQGDLAGARPYYERALAIRERVLGSEHPDTAASLNNFGYLLRAQGNLAEARQAYERALAIYEHVLGPEHPHTAASLGNLGSLLQAQGDLAGARPYFERTLAIRERVLGPEHPDTATSLNNLAGLLRAQGDMAGARLYYERALAIWEHVLGSNHPYTNVARNNLAALAIVDK